MSQALNEPKCIALHSYSTTTSKHAPQLKQNIDYVCKSIKGKQIEYGTQS